VLSTMNVQHVKCRSYSPADHRRPGTRDSHRWVMQRSTRSFSPTSRKPCRSAWNGTFIRWTGPTSLIAFLSSDLIALSELALRQVTGVWIACLAFLEKMVRIPRILFANASAFVSAQPSAQYLIASGSRMAQVDGRRTLRALQMLVATRVRGPEDSGEISLRLKSRRRGSTSEASSTASPTRREITSSR